MVSGPYAGPAMRYLITGGAGFIGSHLSEALLERGDDVVALDNLATGAATNVESLDGRAGFRLVMGSVMDESLVGDLVEGCDVVLHLAAAAGVKLVVAEPMHTLRTNIRGTEVVLDAAHTRGKKVLVTSSSEVYGKNTGKMHELADRVIGSPSIARWAFSESKAVDEFLTFAYAREKGLHATVVRFFNTVGPRQNGSYGYVVPSLVAQALLGRDLTVYGDGNQTRCFCDVEDSVRAVIGLLDEPAAVGEVFNVGSEEEISIRALAQKVLEITGSSSKISHIPYEKAYGDGYEDIPRRVPDTTKIRDLLGWAPRHDLDAIIKRQVAFAQEVGPEALLDSRGR